jgi:hypothetical protein
MNAREHITKTVIRAITGPLGRRLLIAIPFLIVIAVFARQTAKAGADEGSAMGRLLLAVAAFAVYLGIWVGPVLGDFLGRGFGRLFFPSEEFDAPLPMYSIPASRRTKGMFEEAIAGYEEIAAKYPKETRPYELMIEIAILDLRDIDRAKAIMYHAFAAFPDPGIRQNFQRFFDANITRMDIKPGWLREHEERVMTPPDLSGQGPVHEPDGVTRSRFHSGGDGGHGSLDRAPFDDTRKKVQYKKKADGQG